MRKQKQFFVPLLSLLLKKEREECNWKKMKQFIYHFLYSSFTFFSFLFFFSFLHFVFQSISVFSSPIFSFFNSLFSFHQFTPSFSSSSFVTVLLRSNFIPLTSPISLISLFLSLSLSLVSHNFRFTQSMELKMD